MFYGLDVHKEFIQVCALEADGKTRRDFRVGGSADAIESFAKRLGRADEVVLEATFHSWAIVQIFERHVDRPGAADRVDRSVPEPAAARRLLRPRSQDPAVGGEQSLRHYGHITKAGSRNARWLAIEAAHTIARSNAPLAAAYHRVRRRKGHQVAVTALARKLVVVVWRILTTQQPYRYAAPERTRFKLRRLQKHERRPAGHAPTTLEQVYAEAGFELTPPSSGEKRVAKGNKASVTRSRNALASP